MEKAGIYAIFNIVNHKVYIGSTWNFEKRKREHFIALKYNRHYNRHLQNAWNKYGDKNFEFHIIYQCPQNIHIKWEQFFMDYYQSYKRQNGYNIVPKADKSKLSDETKRKISLIKKGKKRPEWIIKKMIEGQKKYYENGGKRPINRCPGPKNGMYGKKHQISTLKKIRKKIGWYDWDDNLIAEFQSIKETALFLFKTKNSSNLASRLKNTRSNRPYNMFNLKYIR